MQRIVAGIFMAVLTFINIRVLFLPLRDRFAPVKTVKAKVVEKHTLEGISRYGSTKTYRYIVSFEAEDKRLSFYVSAFSYEGYRVGERGTLKHQGSRLIDFH